MRGQVLSKLLVCAALLCLVGGASATAYSDFNAGLVALGNSDSLAVQFFTSALADPGLLPGLRPVAYFDRADAYERLKKPDLALADYSAGLQLRLDYDALQRRAALYSEGGQFEAARADYSAAIALRPDLPLGYTKRATFFIWNKHFDDAIADYTILAAMAPEDSDVYVMRSQAYRYKEDFASARRDADQAARLSKDDAGAALASAQLYEVIGKPGDALDAIHDGLRKNKDDAALWLWQGMIQWERANYSDAIKSFEAASDAAPDDGYSVMWLVIARTAAGQDKGDLSGRIARLDLSEWPGALVKLYNGGDNPDLAMTEAKADPPVVAGRMCDANFYVGIWQRMHAKADIAKPLLQAAYADCPPTYPEKRMAVAALNSAP